MCIRPQSKIETWVSNMSTEPKIRLLIADDQEMVRSGVKALLAGTEIKVQAEATTGQAAVKLALESEFDVVLLDVVMPDGDGLTALGRIKAEKPELPVLLFSAFENPASVVKAIACEASGFLLKGCSREELLKAIRIAAAGESFRSREKLRRLSRSLRKRMPDGTLEVPLTEREGDVLRQIVYGLNNKQIAAAMQLSHDTVAQHARHVFRKLGVADRTQAALWAIRNDLV